MDMGYYGLFQNPLLTATQPQQFQQPQNNLRLTVEQLQAQQQQQKPQSNAYTDGVNLLQNCSLYTREKISTDRRFQNADKQFENVISQYIYAQVIPSVLQTNEGQIAAENWYQTLKQLKAEYDESELEKDRAREQLLSDPVVLARLAELQKIKEGSQ